MEDEFEEKFMGNNSEAWRIYRHERTISEFFDDMEMTIIDNGKITSNQTYLNIDRVLIKFVW